MNTQPNTATTRIRHAGPPLGVVATIFTIMFKAGLCSVTMFGGKPYFPGPWEPASTIATFFQTRPSAVLICSFFHFGAAICLGIVVASVVSPLRFLGLRAAALFGGLATAFNMMASASVLWALAHPGVSQDATLVQALYWLQSAFGGSGFSMPMGILMAGVSVPAGFMKLMPKWIVALGLVLAVSGELSWFT